MTHHRVTQPGERNLAGALCGACVVWCGVCDVMCGAVRSVWCGVCDVCCMGLFALQAHSAAVCVLCAVLVAGVQVCWSR